MMNWTTIWELVKINLLYSNPQAIAAINKKKAKYPHKKISAYKSILKQNLISFALMMGLYGFLLSSMDYAKYPSILSIQIAAFSFISLLYFFISLFSVFYDSKDTKLYIPLPIKSSEIYLAKLLASQGIGLSFLSPIMVYLTIAYWQTNHSFLAPLVAVAMFIIILILNNAISLIFLFFVGKLLAKSPHKKLISSFFMFLGIILAGVTIGGLQIFSAKSLEDSTKLPSFEVPYFKGFYDVYQNPFSMDSLLHFWLSLIILVGLVAFIYYRILPNYINDTLKMDAIVVTKRKPKSSTLNSSLKQTMVRHHLSQLKDTTLLMQSFIQPFLFIFMLSGAVFSGGLDDVIIKTEHFGIFLLFGFLVGMLISSPTSFLGVGMSLERENYYFIKSLPINFKTFISQKFWVLGLAQLVFPLVGYTIFGLVFFKIPLLPLLALIVGMSSTAFVIGSWVYSRDYRLLTLNWQNINQLFYRGGGQWMLVALQFLVMILGVLAIAASVIASTFISPLLVSAVITFIVVAILLIIHSIIWKSFWAKL